MSDDGLNIPLVGYITVPVLYGLFVLLSVPLIGNTSNSLDVYNGVVTKSFLKKKSLDISLS